MRGAERYGRCVRGRYVAVVMAVVGVLRVGCSRRARPTYEYEPWVTTTSTADAPGVPAAGAPPAVGGGAAATATTRAPATTPSPATTPAPATTPTAATPTTTLPSVWRHGERR